MLLALDTAGPLCSAAVLDRQRIVIQRSDDIGRGHAEHLMPMLEDILSESDLSWTDLTHIACTIGPGSFTGLRVGLATARGLSLALDVPCQGVSVLEAFAFGAAGPLTVAIDARRDEIWLQHFDTDGQSLGNAAALSLAEALEELHAQSSDAARTLMGSAAPLLCEQLEGHVLASTDASVAIENVARLALHRINNDSSAMRQPTPLYLRAPDAKPQAAAISPSANSLQT